MLNEYKVIKNHKEENEKIYIVQFENNISFKCDCRYFNKSFKTFCKHMIKVSIVYSIDFNLEN